MWNWPKLKSRMIPALLVATTVAMSPVAAQANELWTELTSQLEEIINSFSQYLRQLVQPRQWSTKKPDQLWPWVSKEPEDTLEEAGKSINTANYDLFIKAQSLRTLDDYQAFAEDNELREVSIQEGLKRFPKFFRNKNLNDYPRFYIQEKDTTDNNEYLIIYYSDNPKSIRFNYWFAYSNKSKWNTDKWNDLYISFTDSSFNTPQIDVWESTDTNRNRAIREAIMRWCWPSLGRQNRIYPNQRSINNRRKTDCHAI